jgi:hypothetical protein
MKILRVGAEIIHADGLTDRGTERYEEAKL